MTLRVRVAIAVAVIVAVAIAAAALLSYQDTSNGLRHQVDVFLDARADRLGRDLFLLVRLQLAAHEPQVELAVELVASALGENCASASNQSQ